MTLGKTVMPPLKLKIERPEASKHLNMIIYGASGAGKTMLAGTAIKCEETFPALFIDIDSGIASLDGWDIDVVRPRSWNDINDIYKAFLAGGTGYRSVIIDSLTELQKKFSMGTILGELDKDQYNDLSVTNVPNRQDWMKSGEQMRKLIRAFRDLAYLEDEEDRVHVIMIALEKQDDERRITCPQLPGVLGPECAAYVDVLGRLSRMTVPNPDSDGEEDTLNKRHLLLDEFENDHGIKYMAKSRMKHLGVQLWNPTICDIIGGTKID